MLGDGAVHVSAGGVNPIIIVRGVSGKTVAVKKGGGSARLFVGDLLELDGFKRGDSAKFPDGPIHCFRIICDEAVTDKQEDDDGDVEVV